MNKVRPRTVRVSTPLSRFTKMPPVTLRTLPSAGPLPSALRSPLPRRSKWSTALTFTASAASCSAVFTALSSLCSVATRANKVCLMKMRSRTPSNASLVRSPRSSPPRASRLCTKPSKTRRPSWKRTLRRTDRPRTFTTNATKKCNPRTKSALSSWLAIASTASRWVRLTALTCGRLAKRFAPNASRAKFRSTRSPLVFTARA
mmetsp:Transcript_740/g.2845  ORF Transcript_740/g.2845 Transcript_740/m.2845 type:complete len:203 (+) Transcript_740:1846-2454(+)